MAARQTLKKPAKKQIPQQRTARAATQQRTVAGKVLARRFYIVRILCGLAYTAAVVVLVVGIMRANGWHHTASSKDLSVTASTHPEPVPLSLNTMQVHACSDSIASIASYTYSTKYFFDLKQEGYRLAGTLSQQASNGRDFTDADCAKYFAVRATHPASHIILQLFTRDKSGDLLPYQYKDLKPDSCYFNDTTHRTVCPHAPPYGIFVKD
jgi:hypothetical protein